MDRTATVVNLEEWVIFLLKTDIYPARARIHP